MPGGRGTRLEPAVAGTWYPSDPAALRAQVGRLLQSQAAPTASPAVRAVISPHAGYVYSGSVAAAAFSRVVGRRPSRVLLIGPSHYEAFDGAALPRAESCATPLGEVPFDREALAALSRRPGLVVTDRPFLPEHSLEAEIPFLQEALACDFLLIPVLIGNGASEESLAQVAEALRDELTDDLLIVVSSDFTHYGERFGYVPFTDAVPDRIRRLDLGAVEHILVRDRLAFRRYVARTGATICGKDAIDVLLRLLPCSGPADLGAYDTSGNMTGNWDLSVSYAGIVFTGPEGPAATAPPAAGP